VNQTFHKAIMTILQDWKKLALICGLVLGLYWLTPADHRWQMVHFLVAIGIGGSAWLIRKPNQG
jgi:hypothetical protein